ncbi:hypothetical protein J4466_05025 [Candidatus Pacearchaeota archaeon]|nr:hypothetical protein [Candidatus Pacearchaeota archaeon]
MQTKLYNALRFAVKTIRERLKGRKVSPRSHYDYQNVLSFLSGINPELLIDGINLDYDISDLNIRGRETRSVKETIVLFKEYFGPKTGLQASYCHGEHCSSRSYRGKNGLKAEETEAHWITINYGDLEKQQGMTIQGKLYRRIALEFILSPNSTKNSSPQDL